MYSTRSFNWNGAMQLCQRNGGKPVSGKIEKEDIPLPENRTFWLADYLTRHNYMNKAERKYLNCGFTVDIKYQIHWSTIIFH